MLGKTQVIGPTYKVSHSAGLEKNPRSSISNDFPGNVHATARGTTLWEPWKLSSTADFLDQINQAFSKMQWSFTLCGVNTTYAWGLKSINKNWKVDKRQARKSMKQVSFDYRVYPATHCCS